MDPKFAIIIGGMRCGSTAFLSHLAQHPQLCAYTKGEPHFFSSDENWEKGRDWYLAHWPEFDPQKHVLRLEKTTHYTKYPTYSLVAERLKMFAPDAKLFYIVRDPVDRIKSHLAFAAAKGGLSRERRAKLIEYAVGLSQYAKQLDVFRDGGLLNNIMIVENSRLRNDLSAVMAEIFLFAGVDATESIEPVARNDRSRLDVPEWALLTDGEVANLTSVLRDDALRMQHEYKFDTSAWSILRD